MNYIPVLIVFTQIHCNDGKYCRFPTNLIQISDNSDLTKTKAN